MDEYGAGEWAARELELAGGCHSVESVAASWGVSLVTAGRWLTEIRLRIPGARTRADGALEWVEVTERTEEQ